MSPNLFDSICSMLIKKIVLCALIIPYLSTGLRALFNQDDLISVQLSLIRHKARKFIIYITAVLYFPAKSVKFPIYEIGMETAIDLILYAIASRLFVLNHLSKIHFISEFSIGLSIFCFT